MCRTTQPPPERGKGGNATLQGLAAARCLCGGQTRPELPTPTRPDPSGGARGLRAAAWPLDAAGQPRAARKAAGMQGRRPGREPQARAGTPAPFSQDARPAGSGPAKPPDAQRGGRSVEGQQGATGFPPQQGERSAGRRMGCGAACEAATPETAGAKRAEGDPHPFRNEGASDRRGPARAAAGEACGAGRAQCRTAEGAGPVRRRCRHRHPPQGGRGGIKSSRSRPPRGFGAGALQLPVVRLRGRCQPGAARRFCARPLASGRGAAAAPPGGGSGGRIHIRSWPAGGVCPLATQDRKCGTGKAGSGWRRALCARGQTAHRRSRSRSLQWCSRGRIAADWYRDVPPADQGDSGWS